jgi:hypothetical protein
MRSATLRDFPTNSRRARVVLAALALWLGLLPLGHVTSAALRAQATRIRFARGAISAQMRGRLTRDKSAEAAYVLGAKAGDHMIVNIIPLTDGLATAGEVTSPSGKQDGQHGGVIFNSDLTETGDFRIRVTRNLMGTERADGEFILEVVIAPAYLKS